MKEAAELSKRRSAYPHSDRSIPIASLISPFLTDVVQYWQRHISSDTEACERNNQQQNEACGGKGMVAKEEKK
jgi:hypothetical protein